MGEVVAVLVGTGVVERSGWNGVKVAVNAGWAAAGWQAARSKVRIRMKGVYRNMPAIILAENAHRFHLLIWYD
jgi:hypothetical protein